MYEYRIKTTILNNGVKNHYPQKRCLSKFLFINLNTWHSISSNYTCFSDKKKAINQIEGDKHYEETIKKERLEREIKSISYTKI